MSVRRKVSQGTADLGVSFVQMAASRHNCIFQKIDQSNDLGNDAYIEFVVSEAATGCCVFVQIKSGKSFISSDGTTFHFSTSRQHFEYWASHTLPVCAICYDPENNRAAWFDLTEFLKAHPGIVSAGPYSVPVPMSQAFNSDTFEAFRDHFMLYREQYRSDSNFGLALERFSKLGDVDDCYDGLASLFSFHRNRVASWYYLISTFRQFRAHPLSRHVTARLAHVPGHPDIFWSKRNIIEQSVRAQSETLIRELFGKEEVLALLETLDEDGFGRGNIGRCAHAIIDVVKGRDTILEQLAFDPDVEEDARFNALVLLAYYFQMESGQKSILVLEKYLDLFPNDRQKPMLVELILTTRDFGSFSMY